MPGEKSKFSMLVNSRCIPLGRCSNDA